MSKKSKKNKKKKLFTLKLLVKSFFNLRAWWIFASKFLIFTSFFAVLWTFHTISKNRQYRNDIDSLQKVIVQKDKLILQKQDSIAYLADQFRSIKAQLSDTQLKYNALENEYKKVKKDYNVLGDDMLAKLKLMKSNLYALSNQIAEIEKKIRGKQKPTR